MAQEEKNGQSSSVDLILFSFYEQIYFMTFILSHRSSKKSLFLRNRIKLILPCNYMYPMGPFINFKVESNLIFPLILEHTAISSSFINYSQLCFLKKSKKTEE